MSKYTRGLPQTWSETAIQKFLCSYGEDPFGSLLVMPTPAMARRVRRRMVSEGKGVATTSVTTLDDLALHYIGSFDPDHAILDSGEAESLFRSILLEERDRLPIFFRNGELREGFLAELRVLISVCEEFGVDLGRLRALGGKGEQLATVLEMFQARVGSGAWLDASALFRRAAELLSTSGQRYSQVIFYGLYEPTPAQLSLMRAIEGTAKEVHIFIPYLEDGRVFSPKNVLAEDGTLGPVTSPGPMSDMAGLFSRDVKVDVSDRVFLNCYSDHLQEMRQVAQAVQDLIVSGVSPGDIAVLLPMRRSLAPLVREVFSDFELDYNLDTGTCLAESPVVQTIFDVLQVPHSHYRQDAVVRMLASPYLRARVGEGEGGTLSSFSVDKLSREANVVEGRASWPARFRSLWEALEAEAASPDVPDWRRQQFQRRVREGREVADQVEQLLDGLSSLDAERTVAGHVRMLRETLHRLEMDRHLHVTDRALSRREGRAFRLFLKELDRLERSLLLSSEVVGLSDFIDMLRERALRITFKPFPDRKNAVTVAGLRSAALLPFKHIFIPGLVEGDVPRLDLRHPLLDFDEADRLGLLSNRDILRQERYYFLMALLSATEKVHLSWSQNVDGEKSIPSSFVERVRQFWHTSSLPCVTSYLSISEAQRGLGGYLAGQGELRQEWLDRCSVPPLSMLQRMNVERCARQGDYCTAHDAVLSADPEIVARMTKFHLEKAYSASMLEDYALCPFHYYLRNILALEPIEEVSEDIQARDLGSLFHDTAFRFYSERRDSGCIKVTPGNLVQAMAEMRNIAEQECQRFSYASPAWYATKRRLVGDGDFPGWIGLFLEKEATDPLHGLIPGHFELWVGMKLNRDRSDPSSLERFAEIDLGEGEPSRIRFRCKVDRVDLDGRGGFFVLDYKTGRKHPGPKDIDQGLALQVPLYLLALESVTGMCGIGGAYYTIGTTEETEVVPVMGDESIKQMTKKRFDLDLRGQLRRSASFTQRYIQGMMAARFHPTTRTAMCPTSCDFRHICRFNEMRILDMGGASNVDT